MTKPKLYSKPISELWDRSASKNLLVLPNQLVEKVLLISGSLLLSIWLMRETIALRNILLVSCSLLSFYYLYKNFQELFVKRKVHLKNWIPIILIGLLFIWVITHLIFFSYAPEKQFQELTSTWLRGLMACIVGFTLGLIINKYFRGFDWIMLALISGFFILFFHYAVLVSQSGQVFQQMWWISIYWGKINEVLLGVIFLAGALAHFENTLLFAPSNNRGFMINYGKSHVKGGVYLIGIIFIFHCYVYEIDTRNGIGISAILILMFALRVLWKACFRRPQAMKFNRRFLYVLALMVCAITFFACEQVQRNAGWKTYIEDAQIAFQLNGNSNWHSSPAEQLYTSDGRPVAMNTYERIAWFAVATQLIPKYQLGYGLLHNAFGEISKFEIPSSTLTSSHCGWIDFALSFGIVGIGLLIGSLLWTLALSVGGSLRLTLIVFWISVGLLVTYGFGELMIDHGMEFLLFWLIFLPTLLFPVDSTMLIQ